MKLSIPHFRIQEDLWGGKLDDMRDFQFLILGYCGPTSSYGLDPTPLSIPHFRIHIDETMPANSFSGLSIPHFRIPAYSYS